VTDHERADEAATEADPGEEHPGSDPGEAGHAGERSHEGDAIDLDAGPIAGFVREHLPDPPGSAPILEVGAGTGALAEELEQDGYVVTAIDPRPRGPRVRRSTLERFQPEEPFAAVVAVRSLHHVDDVSRAVATIARFLRPGGRIIVQGFGWDRVDLSTTSWLHGEHTRLGHDVPADPILFYERWRHEHKDLVPSAQLIAALDNVAERTHFVWTPYLAEGYLDGDAEAARRERAAIRDHRVRAAGFRYVGRTPGGDS
jgi:SAM-dependent methyltransferase